MILSIDQLENGNIVVSDGIILKVVKPEYKAHYQYFKARVNTGVNESNNPKLHDTDFYRFLEQNWLKLYND